MLEMRSECERCHRPLRPDSLEARICSFECTFCATCTTDELGGACPNCGGELLSRPVRDAAVSHPAPVLHRYVRAWRSGDLAALVDCYHPDFTLHYGGATRFAGTHEGRDRALSVMAEVSGLATRELVEVDDLLTGDAGGALVVRERLTREGRSAEVRRTLRYRIADGLLAECWLYEDDRETVDRFWS